MTGRVHRISGNRFEVHAPEGVFSCGFRGRLKRERGNSLKLAAVGDVVDFSSIGAGEGVIEELKPRRSRLSRHDVMRPSTEQVIVANPDLLFVVHSARDPDFNPLVVDKCSVMAAANDLPMVLVLNKADLADVDLSVYEGAGYRCLKTSARTGDGVEALRALLPGRTSVFMGPSGVGKSSLLNTLQPGLALKTGTVSRRGEGRHTTSWVELREVSGGWVADTPGMEFFTLWGVTPENLKDHFVDFLERAVSCRYRNCSHLEEEGCAVRGAVHPSRWENYRSIREQIAHRRQVFDRE